MNDDPGFAALPRRDGARAAADRERRNGGSRCAWSAATSHAKQRMIEANLRLVVHLARAYQRADHGLSLARPRPGGHVRPRARGREVRPAPRPPLLHLRDDLDPPVDLALDHQQGPPDPPARLGRPAPARAAPRRARAGRRARPRPDLRGGRRQARLGRGGGARPAPGRPPRRLALAAARRRAATASSATCCPTTPRRRSSRSRPRCSATRCASCSRSCTRASGRCSSCATGSTARSR